MRSFRRVLVGFVALLIVGACAENRGLKIQERASALAHEGKYTEAIAELERLRDGYKGTIAARDVEKQIAVYKGLLESDLKEKRRRVNEALIALGRKLQDYHGTTGKFPASLAELGGGETLPRTDPWGREYQYRLTLGTARYRLACLGADGAPGGAGDNQDMIVDTGDFTKTIAWEDQ